VATVEGMGTRPTRPAWPGWATVAVASLTVVATVLAIAVLVDPGPLPGDLAIVRWWQRRPEPVPTIAEWVRLVTSTEANLVVAFVPAVFIAVRCGRLGVVAIAITVATMLVAQPLLKLAFDRPRPGTDLVDVRAEHTSMSFPSGHSMSTIAVWGVAALVLLGLRRPVAAAAACIPIVLTSQASLVQGLHWPSDSLAGLAIGGISAVVAAVLLRNAGPLKDRRYGTDGGEIDGLRHAGRGRSAEGGDP
jgi:membrane-associated phospholipid phosphatase